MERAKKATKEKSWPQILWDQRFNVAGAIFALITAIAAFAGSGDSWPVAVLSLTFFLLGNLDRIKVLKAGPGGLEITRQELQETRDRIDELKELAVLFGSTTVANIAFMGRWNGFSDDQEEQMISDITRYFDKIGVPEDQKQEALKPRYITTEHDYRLLCTGGSKVPNDLPKGANKEWEALREGGVREIAKPDEIEAFFQKAGILTDQRKDLLEDYRHYLAHRTHRRPDVWARRREIFK